MGADSGLPQLGQHAQEAKSYAGLRNVRSAAQFLLSLAAAAILGPVGGCLLEPEFTVTTLVLREVPSCTVGPAGTLRVGARGDFPAVERQIDAAAPVPIDAFPLATQWLRVEADDDGNGRIGALARVTLESPRELFMLPLGRSCPLGDPAAAASPGAALAPLGAGGLLIAGGADAEGDVTESARVLPPGSDLVVPVEQGMLLRRSGASATAVDERVLVAGGGASLRGEAHDTFEIYLSSERRFEPSMSGRLLGPRRDHGAARLARGRVLLVGGRSEIDGEPLATSELVDVEAGVSSPAARLGTARNAPSVLALESGSVLVALGTDALGRIVGDVERIDEGSETAQRVAGLPSDEQAAVVAVEGERIVYLGCADGSGGCQLLVLLPAGAAYEPAAVLAPTALASAGVTALTRLRLLALRDGRLLITGESTQVAPARRAFLVDLNHGNAASTEISRVPDHLLELADGTVAEVDGFGTSLARYDVISELDDAPDPLLADGVVALDAPARWEQLDGGLHALTPARFDLPVLRFLDLQVELALIGSGSLLLEPDHAPSLRIELGPDHIAFGSCELRSEGAQMVALQRRGTDLWLQAGGEQRRCPLPGDLDRVGLAFEARAGATLSSLRVLRQ
jgi:hypothetical protein